MGGKAQMEGGGLRERNYRVFGVYPPERCAEVYCFKLNFNTSKLVNPGKPVDIIDS